MKRSVPLLGPVVCLVAGLCLHAQGLHTQEAPPVDESSQDPAKPQVSTGTPATEQPPAGESSSKKGKSKADKTKGDPIEVRRFTIGATASFLPLKMLSAKDQSQTFTNPLITVDSTSAVASKLFSYGITGQVALTERFAVNAKALVRTASYFTDTVIYTGTDNPNTVADERGRKEVAEDTRFRYLDFELLVRRYSRDRHKAGWRWFYEAGGTVRRPWMIKTNLETITGNSGNAVPNVTDVVTTNPARASKQYQPGASAGIGFHIMDDFGIRIVPEVVYTRWFGATFSPAGVRGIRNQVEINLSLTF